MARKRTQTTRRKRSGLDRRAGDDAGRGRQIALLTLVLASAYTGVSLISYDPTDPAFGEAGKAANLGGPLGAWLADFLFTGLGYGAWLVVPAGLLAVLALAGRLRLRAGPVAWSTLLGLSVLSGIALAVPHDPTVAAFPAGGLVGALVAGVLRGLLGVAGAWIVVVGWALAALTLLADLDLGALAGRLVAVVEVAAPRIGRWLAAGSAAAMRLLVGAGRRGGRGAAELAGRLRGKVADRRAARQAEAWDEPEEDYAGIETSDPGLAPSPAFEPDPTVSGLAPVGVDPEERPTATAVAQRDLVMVEYEPTGVDEPLFQAEAGTTAPELTADRPRPSRAPEEDDRPLPAEAAPSAAGLPLEEPPPAVPSAADLPLEEPPPVAPAPSGRRGGTETAAPAGREERAIAVEPGLLVAGGAGPDGPAIEGAGRNTVFELPHLGLLDAHERDEARVDEDGLRRLARVLESKLADFGVQGEVTGIRPGPVITTFEYLPAPGIKIARIANLSDDIAMALKALRVRIVAPIPGKGVVGIEIPNKRRQTVWIRDILASGEYRSSRAALPLALGRTVEGRPRIADLARMPHLLIGGATGAGKSVGVNAMLLSLLLSRTPEELRLILIDPKMLEFELYADIPHLLHPVVTDPRLASAALKWACAEMDERYRLLSRWKVRSIAAYNRKVEQELRDWTPEKARRYAPKDWPEDEPPPLPGRLPYIVIVIDELSDLMMVAAKDVEESIIRLAQKARAAGIHVIVATQRPSVNVITGLIKANMPSRIAYQVRTKVDSRTILDQNGAEALLGRGDALFLPPGVSSLERIHGPFCSDDEVRRVTDFLREQGEPTYEAAITAGEGEAEVAEEEYDELYDHAVAYVVRAGKASSSMIQREFKIGYNRAARIIEVMEREGIVGPADGARPREVLVRQ